MGDDPRHGVAAAVVLAEDLTEEAPDRGDGAEQAVAVLDAVLVERLENTAFAQGVGEGKSLVAQSERGPPLAWSSADLQCRSVTGS